MPHRLTLLIRQYRLKESNAPPAHNRTVLTRQLAQNAGNTNVYNA